MDPTLNPTELPRPRFVEIERNLTGLGFFTPSSKRLEQVQKKCVSIVRYSDGKRFETTATIIPSRLYGLPVTADQDKYFALQLIVSDQQRVSGTIHNPVGFTTAQMLRILGKTKSGKCYDEIDEWMTRMTATTIHAVVYLAGRKVWVNDTFHVFDRAVSMGRELPNGRIADLNFVWFSEWQLENINARYQYPVDLHTYFQLRNHIAKALVPLLQVWLHASKRRGRFEKTYSDLCRLLNITEYAHLSKIKLGLGPSLDELVKHAYLASWSIERAPDRQDFKIVFTHGPKFFSDHQLLHRNNQSAIGGSANGALLAELATRGIREDQARKLLASLPTDQPVLDQLEYGDYLIRTSPQSCFRNPPGFYVYLLREGLTPPPGFETSRMRQQRELTAAAAMTDELERLKKEISYEEYRQRTVQQHLDETWSAEQLRQAIDENIRDVKAHFPEASRWPASNIEELALQRLRSKLAAQLDLLTFDAFYEKHRNQSSLAL